MKVNKEIEIELLDGVYKPSEDTYLLIDLIEVEGSEEILELGCGSGIISLHCAKKGCEVLSVDKNERAVKNTKNNSQINDLGIRVKKSDLFSNVEKKGWDIIIFNPPYLPRDPKIEKDDRWDGGRKGDEVIIEFLRNVKDFLNEDGRVYLCFSDKAELDRINSILDREFELLDKNEKKFRFESLLAYELSGK